MQLKRKKITRIIVIIISCTTVIYVSNYTILNAFLRRNYAYSNFDGSFRFQEYGYKGVGYSAAIMSYDFFLKDNPEVKDKQLYRTFWITPWQFWEWNQYIDNNERFKLPYISESEIRKNISN